MQMRVASQAATPHFRCPSKGTNPNLTGYDPLTRPIAARRSKNTRRTHKAT